MKTKSVNYRKIMLKPNSLCVHCGFGITPVLEVAHIDGDRNNNEKDNLVVLCPTCHKMLDLNLISTKIIKKMRDGSGIADWSKRMKDAGRKAAITRKWRAAGKKTAATRQRHKN